MEQPYPMEFVEQGETILLRIEEYDIVRHNTPSMPNLAARNLQRTELGYSVGQWEGSTLAVTTTRISWDYFHHVLGIPLSNAARVEERFTPSADGSGLDLTMTVTDAANFTEPVVMEKSWFWLPDVQVEPYECIVRG